MDRLLVVGAINTDLIAFVERAPDAGETVAGGHFEQHGGGKGANQAVAAARSGADVMLLGAVGADEFGASQLVSLAKDGIDVSGVSTIGDAASGIAIIIVEANGENRICDLPGAREHLSPQMCLRVLADTNPTAILATNELPVDCQRALFRHAQILGIPVWFNVAPYSDGARELLPFVDTLIVNRGEAEGILGARGGQLEINELLQRIQQLGVANVIITVGADGVIGLKGGHTFSIAAEPVEAVDTTGAGDTFCGAWAAATMNGASLEDAMTYANRAAAISVTRRGAQSSIPTRAEIQN